MTDSRPPIRPNGRRGVILRATRDDFRSLDEVASSVGRAFGNTRDPSVNCIETRKALKDLHRAQLVVRTPYGWRCTTAGRELLEAI